MHILDQLGTWNITIITIIANKWQICGWHHHHHHYCSHGFHHHRHLDHQQQHHHDAHLRGVDLNWYLHLHHQKQQHHHDAHLRRVDLNWYLHLHHQHHHHHDHHHHHHHHDAHLRRVDLNSTPGLSLMGWTVRPLGAGSIWGSCVNKLHFNVIYWLVRSRANLSEQINVAQLWTKQSAAIIAWACQSKIVYRLVLWNRILKSLIKVGCPISDFPIFLRALALALVVILRCFTPM